MLGVFILSRVNLICKIMEKDALEQILQRVRLFSVPRSRFTYYAYIRLRITDEVMRL